MALSEDLIKANESLTGLSSEQISALVTLSANNETEVLGGKIGELHGRYDKDVYEATGIEKDKGEKSYDYVRRAAGLLKNKADESYAVKQKITSLEKQISEGKGNEVTVQKLQDMENKYNQLLAKHETDSFSFADEIKKRDEKINSIRINSEIEKAISGIKFKAEYPESVKNTLIESVKREILSSNVGWEEDNGTERLVFKDANGAVIRNPEKGLNPVSVSELMTSKLKDAIDTGRKVVGAGTEPMSRTSFEGIDISSAKTQVDADNMIRKMIMAKGITQGSEQFATMQLKLRTEYNVASLPMR